MRVLTAACLFGIATVTAIGCHTTHHRPDPPMVVPPPDVPRELSKVVLPTYTVEPPDILVIEAIHIVPRHPYLLRTGDVLAVSVLGTLPESPVSGAYPIQPGGIVNLGIPYGTVKVVGLTYDNAQEEIRRVMSLHLREPVVSVSLLEMSGRQQIDGQHLVGPDGTVTLGSYGSVPVVGLTLAESKMVIERHLARFLEDPEVAIDVYGYNSKVYYVVTEGAGLGDGVTRFPITGNDTVLDAIANINGLTGVSSKRIWIARPSPDCNQVQVLPVDWQAVTAGGVATTNYQILPGDRVFVAEDRLIAFDTQLAKIFSPLERAMGFTLLSVGTATRLSGRVLQGGGNPGGGGGGFSGP
ncbi:MAG: polysaccharide biosynthesis/export family protein [Pirellulaceae bacterium]